jgi:hypothetical protein
LAARARRLKHLQIPLLLISFAMLGRWLITASPSPFIDVYVFQQQAAELQPEPAPQAGT